MLVLLESRELVRRDTHPTDARKRTVALTAAGKRKFRELWTAGEVIRAQMFDALLPNEADVLVASLARIAEALNAETVQAGGSISNESQEEDEA
jgi:DNA-binding MarR family transcriptional regulator